MLLGKQRALAVVGCMATDPWKGASWEDVSSLAVVLGVPPLLRFNFDDYYFTVAAAFKYLSKKA